MNNLRESHEAFNPNASLLSRIPNSEFGIRNSEFGIHFYACNLASGDAGEEFLTKLHHLTGATIHASTTKIGNAALGGNWQLDAIFPPAAIVRATHCVNSVADTAIDTYCAALPLRGIDGEFNLIDTSFPNSEFRIPNSPSPFSPATLVAYPGVLETIVVDDDPADLVLDENNSVTRTFEVTDDISITNVTLGLNLDHTFRGDLVVALQSPSGTSVTLINRSDGSIDGNDNFDLLVQEGAAGSINDGDDDDTSAPLYGND
ncbi:MAG: DUF4347 domain-containing protein, partial [Cyanobacteria bacterium J06639_14]